MITLQDVLNILSRGGKKYHTEIIKIYQRQGKGRQLAAFYVKVSYFNPIGKYPDPNPPDYNAMHCGVLLYITWDTCNDVHQNEL